MVGKTKGWLIRVHLVRRLSALSALSTLLFPALARADNPSLGGGMFLGYTFGPRAGVEFGFEAFAVQEFNESLPCSRDPGFSAGPLLQFGLIAGHPRITLALQAGGETQPGGLAFTGELGVTYRFGQQSGFGIHTGLLSEVWMFNAGIRAQLFLDDFWIGGGFRVPPVYEPLKTCAIPGRALRTDAGMAVVDEPLLENSVLYRTSRAENLALAGLAWQRDAQYEASSVLAFLQLAEELLFHDAPAWLVERALDAASDEILHAMLCAELAARYLTTPAWPALPNFEGRTPLSGLEGLLRLSTESWLDGCLNEGAAAKQARKAAQLATDPITKRVQTKIAHDEQRHAELAWNVLSWTLDRGGSPVAETVRAVRDVETCEFNDHHAPAGLQAYGRLASGELNALMHGHVRRSRQQLDTLLSSL